MACSSTTLRVTLRLAFAEPATEFTRRSAPSQQEYFLGNMTEAEYRALLQTARQRAAELIREQQQVNETAAAIGSRVDDELRGLLPRDEEREEEA